MRVPTIDSSANANTGSSGPQATPDAFAPVSHNPAEGFFHGANLLSNLAQHQEHIQQHKDNLDNTRWLSEAVEQEKATLNEFMSDSKNNSKETFADDFHKFAKDRIDGYLADAPSPEAAAAYQSHISEFIGRKYDEALGITERTKLTNTVTSIDSSIQSAIKSFNVSKQTPGSDPIRDLQESYDYITTNIDRMFGDSSPQLTSKLKQHLVSEFAFGTMSDAPEFAKKIVQEVDMDEKTRTALLHRIDQAHQAISLAERDSFDQTRKDLLSRVQSGKNEDKLPLSLYQKFYPGEHAIVQKRADDMLIDTYGRVNKLTEDLSSLNAASQVKVVNDMIGKISSEQDHNVVKLLADKVKQNVEMQDKNRVAWLQQNNPEVRAAAQRAANSTPDNREASLTELNNAVLKYQGYPPFGTDPEEAKKYLNLPEGDHHLMRLDEAEQFAAQINRSKPGEVIKTIGDVLSRYPDQAHQYIAFNDLVSMPGRDKAVRQDYQLAWQNKDQWWVDTYIGALSSEKPLVSLTEEKRKEFDKILDANPVWGSFKTALIGDNFQRAKEIEGYRQGIMAYSHALMSQGSDSTKAINKSIDLLVSSTMGFTRVNGQPLVVMRDRGDKNKPYRTNDEVQDIGRRLGMALKYIDPREVDQSNFVGLKALGDENRIERLQVLRDSITSKGFFQVDQDGQSASLYYTDDIGHRFQVRDKQGIPFRIHFDNLPDFQADTVTTPIQSFAGDEVVFEPTKIKAIPNKTYPLQQVVKRVWFGDNVMKTNWPGSFPWEK